MGDEKSGFSIASLQGTLNLALMAGIAYVGYKGVIMLSETLDPDKAAAAKEKELADQEAEWAKKFADSLKTAQAEIAAFKKLDEADHAKRAAEAAAKGKQLYEIPVSEDVTAARQALNAKTLYMWNNQFRVALGLPSRDFVGTLTPKAAYDKYWSEYQSMNAIYQNYLKEQAVNQSVYDMYWWNPMKYAEIFGLLESDVVGATGVLHDYPNADWVRIKALVAGSVSLV